jgi:NADH dehydrogenase
VGYDVVIAGGGFGGLYAARRLERRVPRHSARILLVTDVNFLLYTPLLPGAASGSLEPRHVVVPLREELEWADIRLGRLAGADPARNEVRVDTVDGRHETIHYDQLIITVGSVSRVLPVPGLAEHGLGFKTLADAIALRNRALLNLEIAESLPDDEARREYLTFVFVGAGYAGLEGIAELQDYVADVIDRYPRCRVVGTRFVLVEARERVMPEVPQSLAEFATRELLGRGMEIRTETMLDSAEADAVTLSTGERIPTRLLCWTAGVKPAPVVGRLGFPLGVGGRIDVDATMRVAGTSNVWAIGDAAAVPDPAKHRRAPSPPTCQHAIRQGRRVAENVAAVMRGAAPRPFRYRTLGVFVDMGQHKAVATILGLRLRGFPAWFAARTYHLAMMPGLGRQVRLAVDWTVGLFFGRASAELGQLGHPAALAEPNEEPAGIR